MNTRSLLRIETGIEIASRTAAGRSGGLCPTTLAKSSTLFEATTFVSAYSTTLLEPTTLICSEPTTLVRPQSATLLKLAALLGGCPAALCALGAPSVRTTVTRRLTSTHWTLGASLVGASRLHRTAGPLAHGAASHAGPTAASLHSAALYGAAALHGAAALRGTATSHGTTGSYRTAGSEIRASATTGSLLAHCQAGATQEDGEGCCG